MRYLLLILVISPIVEIGIFLLSGNLIGIPETLFLIIGTSILGAYLLKKQGLKALRTMQHQMNNGQLPGDSILNGLCILVGGILLLFPGFFTDVVGVFFLFTPTRNIVKYYLLKTIRKKLQQDRRVKIIH